MKAFIKIGDLFNTECQVIAHQVNCIGVMGSGVAAKIKSVYPNVYEEYQKLCNSTVFKDTRSRLGVSFIVEGVSSKRMYKNKYIANIFGQYSYKGYPYAEHSYQSMTSPSLIPEPTDKYFMDSNKLKFTNYEAVYRGLIKVRTDMNSHNLTSIAFPYKFGSDRGGADWNIILSMINSVFEPTDIKVTIYKLKADDNDVVCRECGALMNQYHHKMYKCSNPECTHEYWIS
jgi:hypothetical protein